jgi:RimJ/RimL family protein N-acetyltransferase
MRREITIRELVPSDRRALAFTFGHLSEQSRYQRYFTSKHNLTPRELARLMSVDHWHHEALIAFSPPPRAPIGIARYVRLDEFDVAEVAIEVIDEWQHRGVGTALLTALTERARAAGIRRFRMSMLRDNRAARALASHFAPATVVAAAGNVVELSYAISRGRLTAAPYSVSAGSSGLAGSSGTSGSSLPPSPPSPAPTATGCGFGAGSITVSLTSPSPSFLSLPSPSSLVGQSTITVEPDGTCERRTKSASGSST